MAWSDVWAAMTGQTPSNVAADQVNQARAQEAQRLQDQYARDNADPNSGIGLSPAQQQQMENELGAHVKGQMSATGAGQSGASNDAVQKAIVDYRIQQMGKRMQHLDSLRSAMLNATTPQVVQPSPLQAGVTSLAGRAGQGIGTKLFGPNYDKNDPDSPWYRDPRANGMGVSGPTINHYHNYGTPSGDPAANPEDNE